ncbi:alpha/beta fold hydrolase [Paraflavitalea soli]|uniref:Alpha/beta fold hydrolase n=1 Tax=Paraflavitalea soli TaxID=2315862 RepID=A0A3B7MWZ4_9BACT|nr:alpha/beta fold hydrolase [Paraflavitalea soli]AXY77739.1 alpha/beta fold hydrolase [Paraflavitalea soli]
MTIRIAAIVFLTSIIYLPAQSQIKGTLWDVPAIYKTPAYETISSDSAIGIVYTGLNYRDTTQRVFAYYATPGTLSGNREGDHHLPAVVLVHGGGGTAFREWAILWAKKGYAAIAMDLRGNGPGRVHLENGFVEPGGKTPYFTITPSLEDQWMYQAVADVILAHNLLRSMPEVDSNRTAITGISWGGIITSLMAGVDDRYKAAVPVYGCGYLYENSAMKKELDLLATADRQTWVQQYDPSQYIGKAGMPVLFVNGTNDGHFYLDSYAKTYQLVRSRNLSIKVGLKHNHRYGWENEEVAGFINSYLNHTPPLAIIKKIAIKKNRVIASVQSSVPLSAAALHYTTDTAALLKDKQWQTVKVTVDKQMIQSPLPPAGTLLWFLTVIDERGMQTSSEIQFQPLRQ